MKISSGSGVIALTNRHTNTQTDTTESNTTLAEVNQAVTRTVEVYTQVRCLGYDISHYVDLPVVAHCLGSVVVRASDS